MQMILEIICSHFLFLRYLSDNYEESVKKELGSDFPQVGEDDSRSPIAIWYEQNEEDIKPFEDMMRKKVPLCCRA